MSFNVMVKDGQGVQLQCGSIKSAVKQATRLLGCKKSTLHFISIATAEGGWDAYLFDNRQADEAYWLAALKPTTEVLASGLVPQ